MSNKKTKKTSNKKFTKLQIYNSKKFEDFKDIIAAILQKDKKYSIDEVEKKIDTYMRRKVN